MVSSSSIKPLKSSAAYVPLRCNSDGYFSLFNEGPNYEEIVDVYGAYCTRRGLYPVLKKHDENTELCSEIGADGRTDDLSNHVHYVEIGWNMSAMKPDSERRLAPTEIKDMVCLLFNKIRGRYFTEICRFKFVANNVGFFFEIRYNCA